MDFSRGLLCGLTNEFADFDTTCPKFDKDSNTSLKHTTKQAYISDNQVDLNPKITTHLLILILATLGFQFISQYFGQSIFRLGFENYSTFFMICVDLLTWYFIGHATKHIKTGVISGVIYIVLSLVSFHYFRLFNQSTFNLIPIIIPVSFFAFKTLPSLKKQAKFVFSMIVISKGLLLFQDYPLQALSDISGNFRQIFRELNSDFRSILVALLIIGSSSFTLLLPVLAHKWISESAKFRINSLSLHNVLSKGKMIVFVIVFYSAILLMSFSFLSGLFDIVRIMMQQNPTIISVLSQITLLLIQLGVFLFVCWLYRKVIVEFYLASEKSLSWNYFFAQVPVINIFFWIYNFIAFKPKSKYNRNAIAELLNRDNFGISTVLLFIMGCKLIWIATRPGVEALDIILIFTDLFLLLFYLKNKYGMYVLIVLEILMLICVYAAATVFMVELPESLMSIFVFASIARLIIIYPIFHGRHFTVEVPAN
ncbi:MAG: hypothetical protein AB8B72_13410 [Crocinitomicaceae bacterium]